MFSLHYAGSIYWYGELFDVPPAVCQDLSSGFVERSMFHLRYAKVCLLACLSGTKTLPFAGMVDCSTFHLRYAKVCLLAW